MIKPFYNANDLSSFKAWQEENLKKEKAFILTFLFQTFEALLSAEQITAIKINERALNKNELINNVLIEYNTEVKEKALNNLKQQKEKQKLKHEKDKHNKFYKLKNFIEQTYYENDPDSYNKKLFQIVDLLDKENSIPLCDNNGNNKPDTTNISLKKYALLNDKSYYRCLNSQTLQIINHAIESIQAVQSDYEKILNHLTKPLLMTMHNKEDKKIEFYGSMNVYIEKLLLEKSLDSSNNKINKIKL